MRAVMARLRRRGLAPMRLRVRLDMSGFGSGLNEDRMGWTRARVDWLRWVHMASVAAAAGALLAGGAAAQDEDGEEDEEEKTEYLADFVEDFEAFDGLFPLYRDPDDGTLYMQISAAQLGIEPQPPESDDDEDEDDASGDDEDASANEDAAEGESEPIPAEPLPHPEFIHFVHTTDGTADIGWGFFRGAYREEQVIRFHKRYDTIEVHQENVNFYFDPDNALSRAADANVTRAILASVDIEQTAEDGASFLIKADDLFKGEKLHRVKPPSLPGQPPNPLGLGKLSSSLTRYDDVRNYPENTDVEVQYVYESASAISFGNPAITDPRSISIFLQHSFIQMPLEDSYSPRFDDFRVGYFTNSVDDLTTASYTPYRDVINRWNLVKADPSAPISDPVEPITFWIENTTPQEYRQAVREGALAWNVAFEAAGFSNAIRVEEQPDDADWDAGDIRYNVLRWTSSPNPPFGGYGPSFTNPRTGQILGADIMLENVFVTNRVRLQDVYGVESAGGAQAPRNPMAHALLPEVEPRPSTVAAWRAGNHHMMCTHAEQIQRNFLMTNAVLLARNAPESMRTELVQSAIRELTLHEIGHTLGLSHNMAASSGASAEALSDADTPPGNSVMDYNASNIARDGVAQGQFYMSAPGPYDVWAIQFGYTTEEEAAQAVLERSTERELIFGNDADDMRFAGGNIDPRIMIGDLGADSLTWAENQFALADETLVALKDRFSDEGDTYQDLLIAYLSVTGWHANAANVVTRHVGGVYQQRSVAGQPGAVEPFQAVPRERQEHALSLLGEHVFGVDAFDYDAELIQHLQAQRRGFSAFGVNEDPQVHARARAIQARMMAHLLHPNVLQRLSDSQLYGGTYPPAEYLADMTRMVVADDINSRVSSLRQQLQIDYVTQLVGIAGGQSYQGWLGGGYDPVARSAALSSLMDIHAMVSPGTLGFEPSDPATRAHRTHIAALLKTVGIE